MLNYRLATTDDAQLLFNWANDPAVRSNALNTEPIVWENHVKWLTSRLASGKCHIFIFEKDGKPVGQVRMDEHDDDFVIDYSVDPAYRGMGYGRLVVVQAVEQLQNIITRPANIIAQVKPVNIPSAKVFKSIEGFYETKDKDAEGNELLSYSKKINYMRVNILVTCVASQVIPKITSLIRSYSGAEVYLVGVDGRPKELSVGAYFCDAFYEVPMGSDPKYADAVIDIVKKENIHLIFPGSDEEVITLSAIKEKLIAEHNCHISGSGGAATTLASNKYDMLLKLQENGINTGLFSQINTIADIENFAKAAGYPEVPFIIKPKVGRGSKGFKLIRSDINAREQFFLPTNFEVSLEDVIAYFSQYTDEMPGFFLMEYLPGDKYSTDILIQNGEVKYCVSRNNGVVPKTNPPTQVADIVHDADVEEYVKQVAAVADFDFFLQVEVGRDRNGKVAYIETNPRLDATLPITEGAGINFYHEMINYALGKESELKNADTTKAVRFFRYWDHIFIKN